MLRLENVQAYFHEHSPEAVEKAFMEVDWDIIKQNCLAVLTVEEWDKVSPINGVSADKVIQRRGDVMNDCPVYLIKGPDRRVLYFQPFMPAVAGIKKIVDPMKSGREHAERIAEDQADSLTLAVIQRKLLGLE